MNKKEQIYYIKTNFPLYKTNGSKRMIRHDFFKNINTELQAYLLGFYVADGSIDEKRKTFRIHLSKKDKELVDLYKEIISPEARTFVVKQHFTTGREKSKIIAHESYGVDINSSILVNDLNNLNYGYRKSYLNLLLPIIDQKLMRHFIRGYFDGDGCITGWMSYEKGKSDRFRYSFDISGKTKSLLNDIICYFKKYNIKININYIVRDDMFRIKTSSKNDIKKIYNILYNNSNFYLSRKFNKFNYYVNTEVNQLIADHRNAQVVSANESNNLPKSAEHPKQDENIC